MYIHTYIGAVEHSQDDTNGASGGAHGTAEGAEAPAGTVPTNVGVRGTRQKRKASIKFSKVLYSVSSVILIQ